MRARLDSVFSKDLAGGARTNWKQSARTAVLDVDLGDTRRFSIADFREDIMQGQTVASYALEREQGNAWQTICEGTTIGFRRLDRFDPVEARRIRLTIREAVDTPKQVRLSLFA
jgi:alpha-L-fucosidase